MISMKNLKYWGIGALYGLSSMSYGLNIDVYGASSKKAQDILDDYGPRIYQLEQKMLSLNIAHRDATALQKSSHQLVNELTNKYKLPQVSVDSVYYPDLNEMYTTINICDPRLTKGLMRGEPEKNYQVSKTPDVVDRMYLFIPKAVAFLVLHPEYTHKLNCLDYHCITPEHPEFEKDLTYFRGTVPKQQRFIENTVLKDPQLARRRAAIFLLAYLKNPEEIARILNQTLEDKNSYIRHDALRVYGELYAKSHLRDVPADKVVRSIYSCNEVERNKALIFLNELAENPKYQSLLIEQAGNQLITLLHLKQPNNHRFAYQILQKLSHKNFSDQDYISWNKWLTHVLDKSKIT